MKKISVIIPVYNTEEFIPRCLDSILNNDYSCFEIICINDGSTDNSLSVLNSYADKDERIKVIDVPNGGVSKARNIGLDNATGDYICFIDPDDWVHHQYFRVFLECLENANADMAVCFLERSEKVTEDIDISPDEIKTTVYEGQSGLKNHAIKSSVCGRLYKRDVLESVRFAEAVKVAEDKVFNLDVFAQNIQICSVYVETNAVLYYYYWRYNSAMDTFDALDFKILSYIYLERTEQTDNIESVEVYLEEAFKNTLSVRYLTAINKDKELNNEIKELMNRCLNLERKSKPFSAKKSLIYRVFAYFPFTYWLYRYKTDPTVLDWMKEKKRREKLQNK